MHPTWRVLLMIPALFQVLDPCSAQVTLIKDGQVRVAVYASDEEMAEDSEALPVGLSGEVIDYYQHRHEVDRRRLRESIKDLAHQLSAIAGSPADAAPIRTGAVQQDGLIPVLIGERARERFGDVGRQAVFEQAFRVIVGPEAVGLYGESALASSYAIYELLDRLGCRWYVPGDLGEVVPRRREVQLESTDESLAPATIYRNVWYADEAFRRRNRQGGQRIEFRHALESYITDEQRRQHPQWVAVVGGKPHRFRLRWSHPEVADAIADAIIAKLDTRPAPSVSLSPMDGYDFCESEADRALDAGDWDPTFQCVSVTDRLVMMCNRIAQRVTVKHPQVRLGMLAYVNYARPPVREKLHPSIVPVIAPISYNRTVPMTDDRVMDSRNLRALIAGWSAAAPALGYDAYAYPLADLATPTPMIRKWSRDLPYVLEHGCAYWMPETNTNFETGMHAIYLGMRLSFNRSQDAQAIVDEMHRLFYGSAAEPMARYWHLIDTAWSESPEFSGCTFGHRRRFTPEVIGQARQAMNDALTAAESSVERQRVELADWPLRLLELFLDLRADYAEGRFELARQKAQTYYASFALLGDRYRAQYAFSRRPNGSEPLAARYFRLFFMRSIEDGARIAKQGRLLTRRPIRNWRYQLDPDQNGGSLGWHTPTFDDSGWGKTDPTFDTWATLGHQQYMGTMWYRCEVTVADPTPNRPVHLWIGASDGTVQAFVNGEPAMHVSPEGLRESFTGYCQPASFDITEHLRPGVNRIALRCTRVQLNELGTGGLLGPSTIYQP